MSKRHYLKFDRKAQAALEFSIAMIITATFLVGIVRIWEWGVEEMFMRQKRFEETRIRAAQSFTGNRPQPNFSRSEQDMPNLTEDWVFKGEYYRE